MSVAWTIEGEASKAWDATSKTLEERDVAEGQLEFSSLDPDILTLTIEPEDWKAYTLPDLGQSVTLKRDGSTFFYGTVTNVQTTVSGSSQTISVEVSGPWWWMERIQLTSTKTDGSGSTGTRASYVFGTTSGVDLQTAIEDFIDQAIALGCPMQRGSVATFFDVPRITLNQSTCSQAFSELIRLVPDAFAWFDYTTSPPTLNVGRRGTASTTTLTLGTDAVTDLNIKPIYELKVDRVVLDYLDRDSTGATQFQQQASGTATTGRVQTITISGEEIDTFLPNELFDTLTIDLTTSNNETGHARLLDPAWTSGNPFSAPNFGVSTVTVTSKTVIDISGKTTSGATFTGASLSAGKSFVFFENDLQPPEWLVDDYGLELFDVRMFWWVDGNSPTSTPADDQERRNRLLTSLGWTHYWLSNSLTNPNAIGASEYIWFAHRFEPGERRIWTIPTANIPASGVFTRSADYSFIAPPAGLAANLQAAQDFIPYEGTIRLAEESVGSSRYLGTVINLANSISAHSAMKALVAKERLDIKNGATEIGLGTPDRIDYRTFVDRIRSTPQDNVVYL